MNGVARSGDVGIAWEATGDGHPLLLIQGLGYARWGWEPLVPTLSGQFRVISFDNRGIGGSDVPPGPYDARQMAADAVAVLDAAGAERAHLIGTSLGGMIAQELAVLYPQRVERLVLMSTTPGGADSHPIPAVTVNLIAAAPGLDPVEALQRFVDNALRPDPPPGVAARILQHRLANPQDPAGWLAQAAAGTGYDGGNRLHLIQSPTLILHGTADQVVDHRNADLLAAGIPHSQIIKVEGGGHLFFWEDPAGAAGAIIDFLEAG
jgi:pimeloyl-ACP methyl ester carboxylesterase